MRTLYYKVGFWLNVFIGCIISTISTQILFTTRTHSLKISYKGISNRAYCSTWSSAQGPAAAWMGGGFAGEWTPVCAWLGPDTVPLKLSQQCLLIGYIPIQNKELKKMPTEKPYVIDKYL